MKFLCGRPGCGKESTATLQIDAPSETVSLVDPRISRDGVPLCARHADATTPPLGWTMNDLRSRSRLSAVPDEGSVPTSTPPRVRPERSAEPGGARMSRRQSISERARRAEAGEAASAAEADQPVVAESPEVAETGEATQGDHKFRSSRPAPEPVVADGELATRKPRRTDDDGDAPASRPTRRRDVAEEDEEAEDRFPWHFQYEDDEPREMQASSPLLSRAFRSSTG